MQTPDPPGSPSDSSSRPGAPGRRRLLAAGAGAGLLAAAGGLVLRNQLRHPHRDKTSRPDGRYRRITLACPHPAHDPVLIVAQRLGVFARYNLDVTVLPGSVTGQQALDRLQSGEAGAAVASALSWLPRLLAGLDARLVCGLQSGSARLLVPAGSPIRRIEDLHRRAIGIADQGIDPQPGPASASDAARFSADRLFFSIMMRRKGMNPNADVAWTAVAPADFGTALADGRVQAVVGHDPVIWQVRESLRLTQLASSMTGSYGTRVSRVLGLRGDVLRADPASAVSLVLAFEEAAATVAHHLDETASILADQLPDMDLAQIGRMLQAEGHTVHPVGRELQDQIAQYIDELKLIGLAPDEDDSARLARQYCAGVVHR